ncbi:hypothetical protein BDY19DRAFT_35336 [Irpex rosettiformis]|uniref:Uncharacterized protein n=1 Tax=Irpex rosettiformis TaxID=378272 RepID=A0ACB8UJX4_9APHY|nr:hypothetical protein BDY19DRAFT_35336 [Irpex rosettiformis]
MPILARTQESCRDGYPFCNSVPIGPGPALNAASAKGQAAYADIDPNANTGSSLQGIPLPDPSERNPNAALSRYISANRPEVVLGVLLVFIIGVIALVCWVRFDEKARKKVQKYWAVLKVRLANITKKRSDAPRLPTSGPPSPTAQSDLTSTSAQTNPMKLSANGRPTLDRAPSGSQLSVMKTNEIAALPILLSRP